MVNYIITILNTLIPEYTGNLSNQLLMLVLCFGVVYGIGKAIITIWRNITK